MTTRKLRYFVAVAEELHFSRAAARLVLAQQALSRQIRELEDEVGAQLFERTTRRVTLTAAGEEFLVGARRALEALDRATEAARRADRALAGTLRLGFVPGAALALTSPILSEIRHRYPDLAVEMREHPASDPSAGLAGGTSDVAIIRLPQSTAGIETEPLFVEPVVVMVSDRHRLASHTSVAAAELVDEPITLSQTADEVYRAYWRLDDARVGGRPATVVAVSSVTEEAQLVAAGAAIAVITAAAMRYTPLPGVRFVPIVDWPGSVAALAWHEGERSPTVARFVDTACAVRDRERALVDRIEQPPELALTRSVDR